MPKVTSTLIQHYIAKIDNMLNVAINNILHHHSFQRLEASWRGLQYLVLQVAKSNSSHIKIRLLNISWQELSRDLTRAIEFDQSQIFQKIYSHEFDLPGGEPFGLLIGDYFISHKIRPSNSASDIDILREMGKVAAAAFSPFITAADPSLFGVDSFTELSLHSHLEHIFQQIEYYSWKILRHDADARFIGVVLPFVLLRQPYSTANYCAKNLLFHEDTTQNRFYLWGNTAYCLASIVVRAFQTSSWFTDMCTVETNKVSGGMVSDLIRLSSFLKNEDLFYHCPTDLYLTENNEKLLNSPGFISLCASKYTPYPIFYHCQSVQAVKVYDNPHALANSQISIQLPYLLCASRFSHYLKIMLRDQLGLLTTPQMCEAKLQNWLLQYTAAGSDLSSINKAKYPLRAAKIFIKQNPSKPDSYTCIIYLNPHCQIDNIDATLQLSTEIKLQ